MVLATDREVPLCVDEQMESIRQDMRAAGAAENSRMDMYCGGRSADCGVCAAEILDGTNRGRAGGGRNMA